MKNNFNQDHKKELENNGYLLELSGIYRHPMGGTIGRNEDGEFFTFRLGRMSWYSEIEKVIAFIKTTHK